MTGNRTVGPPPLGRWRRHGSIRVPHVYLRAKPVTICIAAICYVPETDRTPGGYALISACDHMLTAGDIEYEPEQPKVAYITPRTIIMVAGDYQIHSEAIYRTIEQLKIKPLHSVEDQAGLYASSIRAVKRRMAEQTFLSPLGLTVETFFDKQKLMNADLVTSLTHELLNYRIDAECIVAGVDDVGAKLFYIGNDGVERFSNDVGFLAVGSGAWHANSRFMYARYRRGFTLARALLLLYSAKKAAETAPGVGTATDMFMGTAEKFVQIYPDIVQDIDKIYRARELSKERAETKAHDRIEVFVSDIFKRSAVTPTEQGLQHPQSTTADPLPPPPSPE